LVRGVPDAGGRKLRVHFRVYPRTDHSRPALEPIVGAEGGPGYPSIDSAPSYLILLGALRRRHDLIVMTTAAPGAPGPSTVPACRRARGSTPARWGAAAGKLGRAANAYGMGAAAEAPVAVR
jgi:hypothetical protein